MERPFLEPNFSEGTIEFRIDGDEIAVYATPKGLQWLAEKCLALVEAGKKDHIYLGEYQVLTSASKQATLAHFPVLPKAESAS